MEKKLNGIHEKYGLVVYTHFRDNQKFISIEPERFENNQLIAMEDFAEVLENRYGFTRIILPSKKEYVLQPPSFVLYK